MTDYDTRSGDVIRFLADVRSEFDRAVKKFPAGFHSEHEGYAVILEELDELWDTVRYNQPLNDARAEAVQLAAMAMRYALDLCDGREP